MKAKDKNETWWIATHGHSDVSAMSVVGMILKTYHLRYEAEQREWARVKTVFNKVAKEVRDEMKGDIGLSETAPAEDRNRIADEILRRVGLRLSEGGLDPQELPFPMRSDIINAVVHHKPEYFYKLADAVKRIHRRTKGHGPTFKVLPHDPALLHAVMTTAGSTVSVSKAELKKSIQESTGIHVGDKTLQRMLRKLEVPPDKGGRPRKIMLAAKKPREAKQPSMAEVKAMVSKATDAFFKRREIRQKHHR